MINGIFDYRRSPKRGRYAAGIGAVLTAPHRSGRDNAHPKKHIAYYLVKCDACISNVNTVVLYGILSYILYIHRLCGSKKTRATSTPTPEIRGQKKSGDLYINTRGTESDEYLIVIVGWQKNTTRFFTLFFFGFSRRRGWWILPEKKKKKMPNSLGGRNREGVLLCTVFRKM